MRKNIIPTTIITMLIIGSALVGANTLKKDGETDLRDQYDCNNQVVSTQKMTGRGFFTIVEIDICLCGIVARLDYQGSFVCWLGGLDIGQLIYYHCKYVEVEGYWVPCVEPWCDGKIIVETITELPLCGNANGDDVVDMGDVVYLINYLFKGGSGPTPAWCGGDANGDGSVTISDVVYLINYLFKGGSAPVHTCCWPH